MPNFTDDSLPTMALVTFALGKPDSTETPRSERLLAMLIAKLEMLELLDRADIVEMVEALDKGTPRE